MTATLPLPLKAASKPVRRGFPALTCIKCGDASNAVRVNLADASEFVCECGEEYTAEDVREFIGQWQAVLTWIDAAPAMEE
ncbi:MAG TPA: hypothetical protein VN688_04535 [Gemmataceae bacterium]|nr:hypothetical protein [Gemmataceae bacterium]